MSPDARASALEASGSQAACKAAKTSSQTDAGTSGEQPQPLMLLRRRTDGLEAHAVSTSRTGPLILSHRWDARDEGTKDTVPGFPSCCHDRMSSVLVHEFMSSKHLSRWTSDSPRRRCGVQLAGWTGDDRKNDARTHKQRQHGMLLGSC